jgi:hypothetical protein
MSQCEWYTLIELHPDDAYFQYTEGDPLYLIGQRFKPIPHPQMGWPSPSLTRDGWISMWCLDEEYNKACFHKCKLDPPYLNPY